MIHVRLEVLRLRSSRRSSCWEPMESGVNLVNLVNLVNQELLSHGNKATPRCTLWHRPEQDLRLGRGSQSAADQVPGKI